MYNYNSNIRGKNGGKVCLVGENKSSLIKLMKQSKHHKDIIIGDRINGKPQCSLEQLQQQPSLLDEKIANGEVYLEKVEVVK